MILIGINISMESTNVCWEYKNNTNMILSRYVPSVLISLVKYHYYYGVYLRYY